MSDFGSGIEQFGARHELTGWASKADLRRRIAALEADNERLRAELAAARKEWLSLEWDVQAAQRDADSPQASAAFTFVLDVLARYQPEEVPDAL